MLRAIWLWFCVVVPVWAGEADLPRVEVFSPRGTVKDVRQVAVRFAEPMVALGDPRRPAPFTVDCPAPGAGRWADARNWVYDFERDLPAGVACRFTLKPGLRTLAGAALAGERDFGFDTGGPAIRASLPEQGDEAIDEHQVFILGLDGEADPASLREHVRCEIAGLSEQVEVDLLAGAAREAILAQRRRLGYAYYEVLWKNGAESLLRVEDKTLLEKAESQLVVLQCRRALPPEAGVKLVWGQGIRSASGVATAEDQVLAFKTRPAFSARLQCQRVNAQADCLPMLPIRLSFSAQVKAEDLARTRIVDGTGKTYPPEPIDAAKTPTADEAVFKGPFPEKAKLRVELPEGFQDDAGRPLENAARFPLPTATDEYPPLAKFSGDFGIIEREAGGVLPVTLRNLEPTVAGRNLTVAPDGIPGQVKRFDQDDAEIARWIRRVGAAGRVRGQWLERTGPDGKPIWREETGAESVFTAQDQAQAITLPKPLGGKEFEVVGIPLEKSGFYVVELASPKLGAALLGDSRPRYVATAALVSNLAVHFLWGREGSVVWVTHLDKADPVAGAEVRISDYCNGQSLWQGRTGPDGIARIAAPETLGAPSDVAYCDEGWDAHPLFVSARVPGDLGFTVSAWNQGIAPTDFNLPTGGYDGQALAHTVMDRALFRAGETVSMKHFLRRHTLQGFAALPEAAVPTRLEIYHAGSDQKFEMPVRFDATGVAESTWAIPKDAKLGEYSLTLVAEDKRFTAGMFHVEQFRLPTMKAAIQPPAAPLVNARSVPLDVFVAYLSGGGAGNAPVKLRSLVEPKALKFADYPDYSFGGEAVREGLFEESDYDADEPATARKPAQTLALTLDAQGARRATLTDLPVATQPQDLVAELEYQDANGELEAVTQRIPLWSAQVVVGVRTEGWASSRDQVRLRAVALDLAGQPVAGQKIAVELYQRTYYSYRKRLIGGFYAYDNRSEVKRIAGGCEGRTDAQGLLLCTLAPDASGEILLQAKTQDGQGNPALAVASAWVAGEDDGWFQGGAADRMDVLPEQKEYQPGTTARFQVRMPFREATALVSVEREGVAETFVTHLSGRTPVIEVPVLDHHAPNVYISVLAVRGRVGDGQSWLADMARKLHWPWPVEGGAPTALADLGKPAYRLGQAEIRVGWNPYRLDVKVEPDAPVYKVRDTAKVKVKVKRADGGTPPPGTEVALAAVDEALLELKPNPSWQLLEKMMDPRPIEVYTSTAQMQVVGKRHYGRKAVPHGGGGGRQAARELFDTLLLWKGRLPLDGNGEAEVEIPLNDSLSSFRVVAVANAGLDRFGTGSGVLRTHQDVILHSGLPPMVREGDRFSGVVTVRNASQRPIALAVEARVANAAGTALPEFPPRTLELAPGAAQELAFELTVPVDAGRLLWEIAAREPSGASGDRLRVGQEVVPVHPVRVYQATLEQLDHPLTMAVERPAGAVPGRGGVRVEVQARLGDATGGVAAYMARYPYICLEQRISVAVALRDPARWHTVMDALPAYLDRDGLLKYFPSDSLEGSDTLTAYVLAIAHAAGWELPEAAKERMTGALQNFVAGRVVRDSALPTADLSIRKLAAVAALARYGLARRESLDSIAIEPNLWPTSAVLDWFDLLNRLETLPDRGRRKAEAEQILRSRLNFQGTTLGFSTERDDALWWLMLSGDVNAVRMVLEVLDEPGWRADLPRLVRGAVGRQQKGRWNLTTANAWGVLALEKFSAAFESVPVTGETQATLAGTARGFAWNAESRRGSLNFPWPQEQAALGIRQEGTGKPWVMVQSRAALPLDAPLSSGFKLQRTVVPVEQRHPGVWTRGDTARVTLALEAQSDMAWVVVDDPVPAGSTVLGTGLGRDSQLLTQGEKRDDGWTWPAYEERRFDGFRAYYRFVPKGQWTVEYTVRFNNPGRFELPATRIEAMYAPEMFGEYPNAAVEVRPAP